MLKKDYLIKQIEEFGKVLSLILRHKKEENFEAFEQEMSFAFKKFSDIELSDVEELTETEFENEIVHKEALNLTQKKIIAHLLFEKMNFHFEKGDSNSAHSLKLKCLLLYQFIQNNHTVNEYDLDVHYKLSYLKN